ncbi:MAG: glycosyltransferase [Gaiellales bacterium]
MRICYLAWHGSVHTRRWAGWFAERGHDVHVVTCGGSEARELDADGASLPLRYQVHELGTPRGGKLGYLLKLWKARRAVRQIAPDVLHAHWLTSYGLLALACDRSATPLVVTAHGDDVLIAPRSRLMRRIVQRVLRAANLITVPGEPMREAAIELLAPQEPPAGGIAVFQYGVETTRLAAAGRAARSARPATSTLRIVSARALLELYRIDALIDAVALMDARGHDVSLDLYGDGPERARLEHRAQTLGLQERCTFHGAVSPATVEQAVGAADVYVSVSESDGVSLALLEALALGAVPVLSDIAANRPWVNDGETGVLVQIDPTSIASGIMHAAQLDRERLAADNLAIVAERADRDMNLSACELLIDSLIGVTWEPNGIESGGIDQAA